MRWMKFRDLNLKWYETVWAMLPIALAAVGGGIGGLCGGAAVWINIKLMQGQRSAALKYALTGLVSAGAVGSYYVIAKLFLSVTGLGSAMTAEQVDRALESQPVFVVLQKRAPDTYTKIRNSVIEGLVQGKSQAEVVAAANGQLEPLVVKYLPVASDDALLDMTRVLTLELDQIGAKSADACYTYLNHALGSPATNVADFVTPEILTMDKTAVAAVLETGMADPQRIPGREEVTPTLKRVAQQLVASYGAGDVAALAKPASMDHARYCTIVSALYKQALSLPRDQAVPFLRNIFGRGAT